jgi:hypothetical protein
VDFQEFVAQRRRTRLGRSPDGTSSRTYNENKTQYDLRGSCFKTTKQYGKLHACKDRQTGISNMKNVMTSRPQLMKKKLRLSYFESKKLR